MDLCLNDEGILLSKQGVRNHNHLLFNNLQEQLLASMPILCQLVLFNQSFILKQEYHILFLSKEIEPDNY